jgi:hypothetical protein
MKKLLVFASLILIPLFLMPSCSISTYKTFTMKKDPVHYSFEYQRRFRISGFDSNDDGTHSYTILEEGNYRRLYTMITISVYDIDEDTNADDLLKGQIDSIDRFDYELVEQSDLTIDGVAAKKIVWKMWNLMANMTGETKGKMYQLLRDVFLDYKGFTYHFNIESPNGEDTKTIEADKADFEHILQTFKFLP